MRLIFGKLFNIIELLKSSLEDLINTRFEITIRDEPKIVYYKSCYTNTDNELVFVFFREDVQKLDYISYSNLCDALIKHAPFKPGELVICLKSFEDCKECETYTVTADGHFEDKDGVLYVVYGDNRTKFKLI